MTPSDMMHGLTSAPGLEDKKAAAANQSDPSRTPLGQFFTLPPEIRLIIYQDLIKSGSVAFVSTSSAIRNEAIDTLYDEGVCNLEINVFKTPTVYPSQLAADKISNLQIRVNLTDKSKERNERCIDSFNDRLDFISGYDLAAVLNIDHTKFLQIPRKTCKILLDCHPSFVVHLPTQAFKGIATLTGFETLILAIANDTEDSTTRMRSLTYSAKPDPRREMDLALHGKVNEHTMRAYQIAKVYLEETLGPAKWVCNEQGAHLEFHPQEFDRGLFYEPEGWFGEFFRMLDLTSNEN